MRLTRDYLRSKPGWIRVLCAAITVTAAFTLLRTGADPVGATEPTGPAGSEPVHGHVLAGRPGNPHAIMHWNGDPAAETGMTSDRGPAGRPATGLRVPDIAFSALMQTLAVAIFGSGVSTVLYARCRDLATLRALGWRRRQVRRQLMREFTLVAAMAGLLAVLAAYAVEAGLQGRPVSWWPLLSLPAAIAMMLPVAWWQVRRATAEPAAQPIGAKAAPAPRAWLPHTVDQAWRNLLRVPARTSLGMLVIAAACGALGLELDGRRAFSGTAAGSSLSLPPDRIDVVAVLALLATAAATVADLGRLTAAERVGEFRTRRAMGWPAIGVVRHGHRGGRAARPGRRPRRGRAGRGGRHGHDAPGAAASPAPDAGGGGRGRGRGEPGRGRPVGGVRPRPAR
jgi:hypothetical protein